MDGEVDFLLILDSFSGDENISKFCDPSIKTSTPEGVAFDVYVKLMDYTHCFDQWSFHRFKHEGVSIGFYFTARNMLVSFCVNKDYRTPDILSRFFDEISSSFPGDFCSFMWARNTRAINWLKKCGMEAESQADKDIVKLNYKKCQ